MPQFSHLHCHTQFSLLDGAASIPNLFKKAKADGMSGIAITDHGNMFGAFQFVAEAAKHEGVKPIVGCEFYVVNDRHRKTFTKEDRDKRYHQLFLAKNPEGYKNLVKLCSLGFIEGLYGKYPRIDKELILQYHEGLIATTCCIGAMVPQTILRHGEEAARKEFEWWYNIFGEDYYIELQRHNMQEQDQVNEVLLRFAKDYNVKIICSNDSHYVDQKDANAHDILLCINTGEKQSTPAIREFVEEGTVMKGGRFAFWNDQFYFKTQAEMGQLFRDLPQALDNTQEIVDKVQPLKLKQDILLPNFVIPREFTDQDEYLRHITFEGAKERYKTITADVEDRLNFELHTIKTMGFAGYFLIVSDFIKAGRDLGVFVGPGRGSAAGSAVAYCIGITNIDPIKYQLLFERFLNPDRKSMPDIDTDFDDEGRQKVIDYVVEKYGKQQVASIVTYGTMAAKMSIKDVSRVLDLPLDTANTLAKLVPEKPGISLNRVLKAPLYGEGSLAEKESLVSDDLENCKKLREYLDADGTPESSVLKEALILEGSVRGTGVHAAGIIIAPKDLTEIIPVATVKDSDLLLTQFEGSVIEDAGVIKMDFLGLKTLTIIRDALRLIEQNHGVKIDIDSIPLDDKKTYDLYQRGETNGTFQFESTGMQKYLRDLKPDKFDDLIAMNALYRPGPLEYIPTFINRKHGRESIVYDLPEMEEFLKDTYAVTVYQEQVMLLSQKLAGFSKGDADVLRKAMGKKQKAVLDKMKGQFMEGASSKGHPADKLEKIWTDWEAFASYAFNKSHSTCYAFVAYQTAYLKAHYPSEYMAAVLTHSQGNIEKTTFFLEECKRMGLAVKGPDVNESGIRFSVNKRGEIRYGMGGVKGVGEAAVESLIQERNKNGAFTSIYDFMRRLNLRTINKKVMESRGYAGAFDGLGVSRSALFADVDNASFLEKLLRYGGAHQEDKVMSANSLFGDLSDSVSIPEPTLPKVPDWSLIYKLQKEKEVVGIYLSGHPLDDFRYEWENFATPLSNLENFKNRKVNVAGIVTKLEHRISQKGSGWGRFTISDYTGSLEITMFSETYAKFKSFFEEGFCVYVEGEYKQRYNSDEQEFRVNNVRLLETIGEEKTQSITLRIPVERVSAELIANIDKLCMANKGKHTLRMELIDIQNKDKLAFTSGARKVTVGNELISALELLGIECGVN
ncbi:MAG: DNA polymerase III subunit alpha [Saprospiraceae bacterium]|nr:DNA polymerase III subunit alpha [Saprospiraceae bacterium]